MHPLMFAKLDIKDRFWCLVVNKDDAWNFCHVLPPKNGKTMDNIDDIKIVVPQSIQMGWSEAPPYFCANSKMARDVIQELRESEQQLPPHKFEHYMLPLTKGQELSNNIAATLLEVFVDDFIGVINNLTHSHLEHFSHAMLYGLHSVYPPPEVTRHPDNNSCTEKKLQ
eukprot:14712900-Ditylum_brightwellii.AAC.1